MRLQYDRIAGHDVPVFQAINVNGIRDGWYAIAARISPGISLRNLSRDRVSLAWLQDACVLASASALRNISGLYIGCAASFMLLNAKATHFYLNRSLKRSRMAVGGLSEDDDFQNRTVFPCEQAHLDASDVCIDITITSIHGVTGVFIPGACTVG